MFRVLYENLTDNKYCTTKYRNLVVGFFNLVTSDDLDLEYCHKVLRVILKGVRDPILTDLLTLFFA